MATRMVGPFDFKQATWQNVRFMLHSSHRIQIWVLIFAGVQKVLGVLGVVNVATNVDIMIVPQENSIC